MKTKSFASLVAMLVALAPFPAPASQSVQAEEEADLVITLSPGESIDAVNARYGTQVLERLEGTYIFRVRSANPSRTLKKMRSDKGIRKAGANGRVRRHQAVGFPLDTPEQLNPEPSDPDDMPATLYRDQVGSGELIGLGIDATEALVSSGDEIVIAVLDTGVDFEHPALEGHLWRNELEVDGNGIDDDGNGYVDDSRGYDFLADDADPSESAYDGPVAGHGTFIAGLIAIAAPRVRILPVRVMGGDGLGTVFDAAEAISYAARSGARVISMSFGSERRKASHVLEDAIESAAALGVVMVAAAGNDGSRTVAYPASDPLQRVIAVGAVDGTLRTRAAFSNFGEALDVAAPGVALVSSVPGRYDDGSPRYARWSGTSFSTALVAAACSQLLSARGTYTPEEILLTLRTTGDSSTEQEQVGTLVDFLEAVGRTIQETTGDLEVWLGAELQTSGEDSCAAGYTVLRTIGQLERLTAVVHGLEPGARYSLFVLAGSEIHYVGHGRADELGHTNIAAAKRPQVQWDYALPVPIAEVERVIIRDRGGAEVATADVLRDSPGVQVWAGVGMKVPEEGGPLAEAFGWAWYGAPADDEHVFDVVVFGIQEDMEYVLRVDGSAIGSGRVEVGEDSSIQFSFASSDGFPGPITPVTRAGRVELWIVDREGVEHLVVAGDLRGQP